ncbi:hypothetical protein Desaci_3055 [Desulfosporosinus acidiphilus SJ4]|uniref:Uncharacterized protein n=1 Tax=Desulfosporosinus acidiphilus (strain DSM 22704 / JCM 16185 / SJ4) TaxID=646529 RepID=I4D838_DESAJ|nr:hypothetical protein Desaci_3055 [Desulfosporosinus acidiphilus SJ4]
MIYILIYLAIAAILLIFNYGAHVKEKDLQEKNNIQSQENQE